MTTDAGEFYFTQVTIDGVEHADFGFRSFTAHLNDYDLFRDYAPCWDGAGMPNGALTLTGERRFSFCP